jgi:hypothetical protein
VSTGFGHLPTDLGRVNAVWGDEGHTCLAGGQTVTAKAWFEVDPVQDVVEPLGQIVVLTVVGDEDLAV